MWNAKKFDKAVSELPKLYATDSIKAEDKIIRMHLFIGGSDWYVCEGDVKEGVLFGFACINGAWQYAEWGYASIEELKSIRIGFVEVDFDLHWKAQKFSEIPKVQENLYFDPDTIASEKELIEGSKDLFCAPDTIIREKGSKEVSLRDLLGEDQIEKLLKAGLLRQEGNCLIACLPEGPKAQGSKIPIVSIELTRAEGLASECGKPVTVATLKEADKILAGWALTAPKKGAYDKCDFTITFRDGETYSGRYDVHNEPEKNETMQEHILGFLEWYAGKAKNPYCGQQKYEEFLASDGPEIKETCKNYLEKYSFEVEA